MAEITESAPPSFAELVNLLWQRKYHLLTAFIASALLGGAIALLLPKKYIASTEVAPAPAAIASSLLSAPLLNLSDRDKFGLDAEILFSRYEQALRSSEIKNELYHWYLDQLTDPIPYDKFLENLTFQFPDREQKNPLSAIRVEFKSTSADLAAQTLSKFITLANADAFRTLSEDFYAEKALQINAVQQTIDRMRAAYKFDVESNLAQLYERKAQTEILLEHTGTNDQLAIGDISIQIEELPIYLMHRSSLVKQLQYVNTRIQQVEQRKNPDLHIENMPSVLARKASLEATTLTTDEQPFFRYSLEPQPPESPASPHKPLIVVLSALFGTALCLMVIIFSHLVRTGSASRARA